MFKISGVYCAVLTPLNRNLDINNNELHLRHCQSLMQKGLDGLTIFGTNGEASSFSVEPKNSKYRIFIRKSNRCSKFVNR